MKLHPSTFLALVGCLFADTGLNADPPVVAKPPDTSTPKVEKPKKEAPPRPTTKEEFAALAKDGPKPPWLPFRNQTPVKVDRVYGTVVEVAAESIELRPNGEKETVKFPPHVLLATGAICHWELDSFCYLLDDVKKGDEVMIGTGTVDEGKGPECLYVCINRRPGGKIPPSRKPNELNPYHVRQQRKLDAEDKGEYTPEELKAYQDKVQLCAEKGLPPPPPLPERKPRAKSTDEPKKDEPKKEDPKKKD